MQETLDAILETDALAVATLTEIRQLLGRLLDAAKATGAAAPRPTRGESPRGDAGPGEAAAGVKQLASSALGAATSILGVVGAITGSAFAVLSFVKALNPGLVAQFGLELRNLTATVGSALEPIISNAIPIIRQLAAVALDLAQEVRPLIDDLSAAIGALLTAYARYFAIIVKVILQVMAPFIKEGAKLIGIFAQLVDVGGAFLEAVVAAIQALLQGSGIADVFQELNSAINQTILALARMAARVLVFFGGAGLVAKMAENLRKRIDDIQHPKGGLVAAPTGVSTGGVEDIAKRFAERAFIATGAGSGSKKSDTDLLEGILGELEAAQKDDNTWKSIIRDAIKESGIGKAADKAIETTTGLIEESVDSIGTPEGILLGPVGAALFNRAAKQFR